MNQQNIGLPKIQDKRKTKTTLPKIKQQRHKVRKDYNSFKK